MIIPTNSQNIIGGTVDLSKVKSYIGDFLDTQNIVVIKGVIDKYNRVLVS